MSENNPRLVELVSLYNNDVWVITNRTNKPHMYAKMTQPSRTRLWKLIDNKMYELNSNLNTTTYRYKPNLIE